MDIKLLCLNIFCIWLEDQKVNERLIEISSSMQKIINYWMSLVRSEQPQTKGFEAIGTAVKDPLIVAKLQFSSFVAS